MVVTGERVKRVGFGGYKKIKGKQTKCYKKPYSINI